MPDNPEGDHGRLVEWLREQIFGASEALNVHRIATGNSNVTYLIDGESRSVVVRHPPPGGDPARARRYVEREHNLLHGLQDTAVVSPEPLAIFLDDTVTGAPFFVMERMPGTHIGSEADAEQLPVPLRRALGLSLARELAALHAVVPSEHGLAEIGPSDDYVGRQLRRWADKWHGAGAAVDEQFAEVTAWLTANVPRQREVCLVHGDYNLGNTLIDRSTGEISAILDWELCALGDPLADVGTMLAYWPDIEDAHPGTLENVSLMDGFLRQRDLIHAYAEASGRDLGDLDYFRVLAYWKLAAIIHDVHFRWSIEGDPAGENAHILGERANRLMGLGHRLAMGVVR